VSCPEAAAVILPLESIVMFEKVYEPGVTAVSSKEMTGFFPPVEDIGAVPVTESTYPSRIVSRTALGK